MLLKCIKNPNSILFSKKKGFSFLEIMISIFIFSLMMTTISVTFASLFENYRNSRAIQMNLENAQFIMNTMAKSLRTSSVISNTASSIKFYNYSDSNCFSYKFEDNSLQVASVSIDNISYPTVEERKAQCSSALLTYSNILTNVNDANFSVIQSSEGIPNVMGKVTVSIDVCANSGSECSESVHDRARIQSSVSLRDYSSVGL
jgi:prepilin-type N-terminal cleavage/methylation domain-containing protein